MDFKSTVRLSVVALASMAMTIINAFAAEQTMSADPDYKKNAPCNYISSSYYTKGGVNLFIYGDLLYMTAREEGLEFAGIMDAPASIFVNNASVSPIEKTSFHSVDFDWHLAFRLGAGWHMHHDFWDISLEWLHYDHRDHRSLHPNPATKTLLIANLNNQTGSGAPSTHMGIAESAKETWKLDFNTLDLTLAKSFWATHRLSLTPHAGIRSSWIDQHIKQTYVNVSNPTRFVGPLVENKNRQDFWGIGLRAGIGTRWAITRRLSLFSDVSFSPLWACIELKNKEPVTAQFVTNPLFDVKDSYHALKFNTDIELGAQWDFYFSHDAYHLGLRAAWEYHLWINQNQINHFCDRTFANSMTPMPFYKDHGNLSLYGASFGIIFDF